MRRAKTPGSPGPRAYERILEVMHGQGIVPEEMRSRLRVCLTRVEGRLDGFDARLDRKDETVH